MILQALTRYYEDLLQRGEIAAPGWSPAKISFALCLDKDGQVTQVIPTMEEVTMGKKTVLRPQSMILPSAVKRTVGIASNFLWDNSAYLLGVDQKGKPERSRDCFRVAASLHHAVLDGVDSPAARAILAFFDTWQPEKRWSTPPCPGSTRRSPQAGICCSGWMAAIFTRTLPSMRHGSGTGTARTRTL